MPITVKHGEDFAALAELALLAGMGRQEAPQAPQISAGSPASGSRGGGGGRGIRHGRGAPRLADYGRIRYPSSREELVRESAKRKARQDIQQEADQRASVVTEFKWTPKQKRQWSELENAKQQIMTDQTFSEEEKERVLTDISLQQMQLRPTSHPLDPNEPTFEEGQEPGKLWEHPVTGGIMRTVIKDGVPTPELVLRPDQTIQYLQEKLKSAERIKQQELQISEATARQKRIEDVRKFRYELSQKINEVTGQPYSGPEIDAGTMQRFGGRQVTEFREQDLPGQDRGPATPAMPRELIGWSRQMGIKTTEADADLPEFVGKAQAFMREMEILSKRGQDISRFNAPILEARAILKQYRAVIEGR